MAYWVWQTYLHIYDEVCTLKCTMVCIQVLFSFPHMYAKHAITINSFRCCPNKQYEVTCN